MKHRRSVLTLITVSIAIGSRSAAPQESILYSFGTTSGDGAWPYAGLIFDAKGNLFGTTLYGGSYGAGYGPGTVFELTPTAEGKWEERVLHTFGATPTDGQGPFSSLIFDAKGNLYGTTDAGGNGMGTVFELSPPAAVDGTWKETVLYSFGSNGPSDGEQPLSALIFDAEGNLYGTTCFGGNAGQGTVFQLTPASNGSWTEKVLYSFGAAISDGFQPYDSLIFDAKGNLYGTALDPNIFELTSTPGRGWEENVLFCCSIENGQLPYGSLIFDSKGNLFSTNSYGGPANSYGTVFQLAPVADGGWTEKVLHSFVENTSDGYQPEAGLTIDASGNLYGTTVYGGAYASETAGGIVFELSPSAAGAWTERVLHSFAGFPNDGAFSHAGLIFDGACNLYGTTAEGGTYGAGSIFKVPTAAVATPEFSPAPGNYALAQTIAIINASPCATIYYTSNGDTPTTVSAKYTAPIEVSRSETIKAIAINAGLPQSDVASATFMIGEKAAKPRFSKAGGTYGSELRVTISDATRGGFINFTVDGSEPTSSSPNYTVPITISKTTTIKAIEIVRGYLDSDVATATYEIDPPAAKPVFSLAAGTYTSAKSLTITDATPGANIYYTTNGATPTTSSSKFTAPIALSTTGTIKAIADAPGYSESPVHSANYTIELPAATPTFSLKAGTYKRKQTLEIADAASGATIYYTTNGSTPVTASTKYTGPITVSASETIKAIAKGPDTLKSAVASATYSIK